MDKYIEMNPIKFLVGMTIEACMETNKLLHELILKYKANNIDVIPISELEAIEVKGIKKTLAKGSLTKQFIGDLN